MRAALWLFGAGVGVTPVRDCQILCVSGLALIDFLVDGVCPPSLHTVGVCIGGDEESATASDPAIWRTAFLGALALAVVIVVDVLVRRRWMLARDILLALSVVAVMGSVLGRIVDSEWSRADAHVFSNWASPNCVSPAS
jgi:hypothetical protein